jgi:hypothetical protein
MSPVLPHVVAYANNGAGEEGEKKMNRIDQGMWMSHTLPVDLAGGIVWWAMF